MTENNELKPCPFCGGEAFLNENVVSIHCPECCGNNMSASVKVGRYLLVGGVIEKTFSRDERIALAIERWNLRAPTLSVEGIEAALESVILIGPDTRRLAAKAMFATMKGKANE